ncbi:hypothetical protein F511_15798 [Dorcoceras hygrometricum]|uniref:Uncharacterized protein n=1 Tax=Dorcoceras hygrometricum TaxID=472368 RepID=A0A2Z7BE24_9LAMI|nr:hypothetical protein F511_15798 [Dorcoceras hygrometricum]
MGRPPEAHGRVNLSPRAAHVSLPIGRPVRNTCAGRCADMRAAATLGRCATIAQAGSLICACHCAASAHVPRAHMRAVEGRGRRHEVALPKSSSYAQHIEVSISAGISNPVLGDPQWFRDTASRGPTTIVAPKSQFPTCPSDHDRIGYPRMSASGESSTTMHRLLHASGPHPIPPPNDPKHDAGLPLVLVALRVLLLIAVVVSARMVEKATRVDYCWARGNQQQEFPLCNCWFLYASTRLDVVGAATPFD